MLTVILRSESPNSTATWSFHCAGWPSRFAFRQSVCVFALARQVGPLLITLMCSLCGVCICVCVCIGRGCLCSLRGTIIAGNPFHGRTNLFFAGVTPSRLPPLFHSFSPSCLPCFLCSPCPRQGSSLHPCLVFCKGHSSILPSFSPRLPLSFCTLPSWAALVPFMALISLHGVSKPTCLPPHVHSKIKPIIRD